MSSKCYTCKNFFKVELSIIRSNEDQRVAPRSSVFFKRCLVNGELEQRLLNLIPKNHQAMFVADTSDLLIKHCTKYDEKDVVDAADSLTAEQLAYEVGTTYVNSDSSNPKDQWQRIINLLNKNGFTIVRREVDET